MEFSHVSIVIPAKNEAQGLRQLLPILSATFAGAEIIVVNDGSSDETALVVTESGATLISHRYSLGNGAAIKTGARAASNEVLVFMDADGQHAAADVLRLLERYDEGYDMVVGARKRESQASNRRWLGNAAYNFIASKIVGHKIDDLTSGLRVVTARKFRNYLYLLPNGFSYPTTITMAFFRSGYAISYVPIVAAPRLGESHLRVFKDGIRFLLIIFKVATLYSPLKVFFPVAAMSFLTACIYYFYTYMTDGRLTNMVVLLFVMSVIIFMIGLISEQITMLLYKDSSDRDKR
ncbi:MAG: glycosyltransferase involved in cell wall biosynthesis [Oceanicoccus sp.]|jgi:glycosyltransferase involved in cell wall biosynthesis